MDTYCTVAECDNPTRQGRAYCDFHRKRLDRGQSLTAPKQVRLKPTERLLEAALALADAETDEEYEARRKELLRSAKQMGPNTTSELIRQGMGEARRRGVHVGRPAALTAVGALALVQQHGSMAKAAQAARVSRVTVWRALRRVAQGNVSQRQV